MACPGKGSVITQAPLPPPSQQRPDCTAGLRGRPIHNLLRHGPVHAFHLNLSHRHGRPLCGSALRRPDADERAALVEATNYPAATHRQSVMPCILSCLKIGAMHCVGQVIAHDVEVAVPWARH